MPSDVAMRTSGSVSSSNHTEKCPGPFTAFSRSWNWPPWKVPAAISSAPMPR